jgi:hopanoid-associated phosphorylase
MDDPGCAVVAVCGMAFEAAIAAGTGVVTLCAPGAAPLDQLLRREAGRYRGIVSFGTAGGLDPALAPGACIIADAVVDGQARYPVDAVWLAALRACLPRAVGGMIAGVDQPLVDAAAKASLRQSSGACAVDMESHRAALMAQRFGLPFAACRVVVDPAHRSLPASATAGLRNDGTVALLQVMRALASDPGQLPALIQLALDARVARQALRVARSLAGTAFAMPR